MELQTSEPLEQTIYTFGYEKRDITELLKVSAELNAIVIDTRFNPHSYVRGWNREQLNQVLPEYLWFREFGNINYQHPEKGMEIFDYPSGEVRITPFLEYGRSIILLCYERNPIECHRTIIANQLSARFGLPIEHIVPQGTQLSLF